MKTPGKGTVVIVAVQGALVAVLDAIYCEDDAIGEPCVKHRRHETITCFADAFACLFLFADTERGLGLAKKEDESSQRHCTLYFLCVSTPGCSEGSK